MKKPSIRQVLCTVFGLALVSAIPSLAAEPGVGDQVPVSTATSVTVYETTGELSAAWTFTLSQITGGYAMFNPWEEFYTITTDGTLLTITCYREPEGLSGVRVGNNINAVRLNGVPGYPDGIWASSVESVSLGIEGTLESAVNALGPSTQVGPYLNSPCTYLGDAWSSITLGFSVPGQETEVSIDFDANTLNVGSKGRMVTVYIELPQGMDPMRVDLGTIMLNGVVPTLTDTHELTDIDGDDVPELMVKFDRSDVMWVLAVGDSIDVRLTGELTDGTHFFGEDSVRVIAR